MPDAQNSRWSTSQLLPPTLVFLAALAITVAVASPLILAPELARVSLDTDLVSTAKSTTPVATLDRCSLDGPRVAHLPARSLIRSQRVVVVRPADRSVATLQAGTIVRRDDATSTGCTDPTILALLDRVTIARTTAAPVGESAVQTDSTRPATVLPDRRGRTYLFAPRTQLDADLGFFDPLTRRSVPLTVLGPDRVDGLDVTRVRAEIPDTNLATLPGADPRTRLTKPGGWFGWPGATVTADLHQRGRYTLWIDEKSGLIVDGEIAVTREYIAGDRRLTEVDATFRYDSKTRSQLVAAARDQARPVWLASRLVPLVAVLSALAISVVWVMHRRRARA